MVMREYSCFKGQKELKEVEHCVDEGELGAGL